MTVRSVRASETAAVSTSVTASSSADRRSTASVCPIPGRAPQRARRQARGLLAQRRPLWPEAVVERGRRYLGVERSAALQSQHGAVAEDDRVPGVGGPGRPPVHDRGAQPRIGTHFPERLSGVDRCRSPPPAWSGAAGRCRPAGHGGRRIRSQPGGCLGARRPGGSPASRTPCTDTGCAVATVVQRRCRIDRRLPGRSLDIVQRQRRAGARAGRGERRQPARPRQPLERSPDRNRRWRIP